MPVPVVAIVVSAAVLCRGLTKVLTRKGSRKGSDEFSAEQGHSANRGDFARGSGDCLSGGTGAQDRNRGLSPIPATETQSDSPAVIEPAAAPESDSGAAAEKTAEESSEENAA